MMPFSAEYSGASVFPSPNHGERQWAGGPDIIMLHYTGMQSAEKALARLCDPESQVSSHYFVFEDGHILQLVPEDRRAWHAGIGSWAGDTDVNSRSIGIEIANAGHPGGLPEFQQKQIEAVIELCLDCGRRWSISPERVLGHSDTAPVRKIDPGERFPWRQLHAAGVGHWVEPLPVSGGRFFQRGDSGQPVEALQSMLAMYGYGIEITGDFCERTAGVVEAFQRHFRPEKVDGVADFSTIDTLHRLLSSIPK